MTGKEFDPIEIVEARIARGEITRAEVDRVLAIWRERLLIVTLPHGELLTITERDIHHLMDDDRLVRKPERIERLLDGIFEIRTADADRRRALSQWYEGTDVMVGYAILDVDGTLRSAHVTSPRKLRSMQRKGTQLWRR